MNFKVNVILGFNLFSRPCPCLLEALLIFFQRVLVFLLVYPTMLARYAYLLRASIRCFALLGSASMLSR